MIVFEICLAIWATLLAYLRWHWHFYPKTIFLKSESPISVIIAARNEEQHIKTLLDSFEKQTFKAFEIIIIDDDSTDHTEATIENFKANSPLNIHFIKQRTEQRGNAPKKNAILSGIKTAKYDIIYTTDADCELSPNTLALIAAAFLSPKVQFLSGPVAFKKNDDIPLFSIFQRVEFASLLGVGAASIAVGQPSMCSAANMAYRKTAFYAVNGFEGNLDKATGDDEYLLHKINKTFGDAVYYLKNQAALVLTNHPESIQTFIHQRVRWASKWDTHQGGGTTSLAVFVFMLNLSQILALFIHVKVGALLWAVRICIDFVFLYPFMQLMGQKKLNIHIIWVSFIIPFYAVFFGIRAQFPKYQWKNSRF